MPVWSLHSRKRTGVLIMSVSPHVPQSVATVSVQACLKAAIDHELSEYAHYSNLKSAIGLP